MTDTAIATSAAPPGSSGRGLLSALSGPGRMMGALAVVALVAGGLAAIMLQSGGQQKALLYSGLDLNEAAEITGRLDTANIRYELRADGSAIFIERERVADARMMLSAEGLPSRGSVGYEIFDKGDALGATSFVQNINRLRALEGELARTIGAIESVRSARVHLVMPERRLFEQDARPPTASIVVEMRGHTLTGQQVRAIRNLVAGAVPGLEPERVTLLDNQGRLLAAGAEGGPDGTSGVTTEERRAALEDRVRRTVSEIVESIAGPGAARVQVTADVDFNRVTQSSETFDPDGRVAISTETLEDTEADIGRDAERDVSVTNNIPAGEEAADPAPPTSERRGNRTEERINYKVSSTTRTEVMETGRIRRLSVAVALDDVPSTAEDGTVTYTPRAQEEIDRILTLVRSAVGFDAARGDVVEVVNVRFARADAMGPGETAPAPLVFDRNDIMRGVELGVLLVAALALIFFVLRPLAFGLTGQTRGKGKKGAQGQLSGGAGGQAQLTGPGGGGAFEEPDLPASAIDQSVSVAQFAGRVKASSVKKVAELVAKQPEESATIMRSWMATSTAQAAKS
jgi:flagellar M-ring protein FliF